MTRYIDPAEVDANDITYRLDSGYLVDVVSSSAFYRHVDEVEDLSIPGLQLLIKAHTPYGTLFFQNSGSEELEHHFRVKKAIYRDLSGLHEVIHDYLSLKELLDRVFNLRR